MSIIQSAKFLEPSEFTAGRSPLLRLAGEANHDVPHLWVASRDASRDSTIKRKKYSGNELKEIMWNTYRVLLTRGMQSTLVYSTDFETRQFLKSLLR